MSIEFLHREAKVWLHVKLAQAWAWDAGLTCWAAPDAEDQFHFSLQLISKSEFTTSPNFSITWAKKTTCQSDNHRFLTSHPWGQKGKFSVVISQVCALQGTCAYSRCLCAFCVQECKHLHLYVPGNWPSLSSLCLVMICNIIVLSLIIKTDVKVLNHLACV